MYTPRGYLMSNGVARLQPTIGESGWDRFKGGGGVSSKPRDLGNDRGYRAIAGTGWRGVNAIESTCGFGVEVAGIMRAMRLVEINYELRAL
jgi:hypothetical protein